MARWSWRDGSELRRRIREAVAEIRELDRFSRSGDRPAIERHLRKLVIMLRVLGMRTSSSCHGHAHRPPGHPYIDLPKAEWARLAPLLLAWNQHTHERMPQGPRWTAVDRGQDLRLMPRCPHRYELARMQASADRFGTFLLSWARQRCRKT